MYYYYYHYRYVKIRQKGSNDRNCWMVKRRSTCTGIIHRRIDQASLSSSSSIRLNLVLVVVVLSFMLSFQQQYCKNNNNNNNNNITNNGDDNDDGRNFVVMAYQASILLSSQQQQQMIHRCVIDDDDDDDTIIYSNRKDTTLMKRRRRSKSTILNGWVQQESNGGEWEWIEDDPNYIPPKTTTTIAPVAATESATRSTSSSSTTTTTTATATPKLPSGSYKPKQSLGQNYLKDPNTVNKICHAYYLDATTDYNNKENNNDNISSSTSSSSTTSSTTTIPLEYIVELGPGAGALTDVLLKKYCSSNDNSNDNDITTSTTKAYLHCIEIDVRSVEILQTKHSSSMKEHFFVEHMDVLQINYHTIYERKCQLLQKQQQQQQQQQQQRNNNNTFPISSNNKNDDTNIILAIPIRPLSVIGNLPYYITSQILFAFCDAVHVGLLHSATVTMQYEVGQRIIAQPYCKEYGILSVVFQIYCSHIRAHYKIPPTVFYPQPKVDSILIGFHFVSIQQLYDRLSGIMPYQLRRVITVTFQQRRKTIRNSIQSLLQEIYPNDISMIETILSSSPLPLPLYIQEQIQLGTNPFYNTNTYQNQNSNKKKAKQKQSAKDVSTSNTTIITTLLPLDWCMKRPEELSPAQFIELTRLIYSRCNTTATANTTTTYGNNTLYVDDDDDDDNDNYEYNHNIINNIDQTKSATTMFGNTKVWRKLKHGI